MGKKVCFLVSEHPFLDARIFKKEAKSLLKHGYDVTMIVPRKDGYLFDVDGTFFKDKFLTSTFIHEGIKIVTYEQERLEKNIKTRYQNLRSKTLRLQETLTKLGLKERADIYHAHEFLSLYCGVGIKRSIEAIGGSCKLIFDSHELEPDPSIKEAQRITQIKQQMMQLMVEDVDYIITVSPSIQRVYQQSYPQVPVEIIYNSPPLSHHQKNKKLPKKELTLGFEGIIDQKRTPFSKLIQIVEMCNQSFPLKLKIIGGPKAHAEKLNIPRHLANRIEWTGWVDYHSIPTVMKDIDIGIVDLDAKNSLNNRYSLPNKFFSYLNQGVPVIANKGTDIEQFINQHQCGVVIRKQQAEAIDYYQVLKSLFYNQENIHKMGKRARKIMETTYSWEHMEKRFVEIYNLLL